MKLIDILARDLAEWPSDWAAAAQDSNGLVAGFRTADLQLSDFSSWNNYELNAYIAGSRQIVDEPVLSADYDTAIVTRAQWQAAVDALKAGAWTGTGLPPVGTACEIKRSANWTEVEVIAHYNGQAVIAFDGDIELRDHSELRPICTPEQVETEERENAIQDLADELAGHPDAVSKRDREMAAYLYGKGYRRQVTND